MQTPSAELSAMIEAGEAAGAALLKRFAQVSELAVRAKSGPADLVSIADEEAEEIVRAHLGRARPDYGFLGEEGGAAGASGAESTWIVDPLDGTTNFLFGAPLWGVIVGLARGSDVVAGVIVLPALKELYVAEAGKGAWLNGVRTQVSKRAALIESTLSCGIPFAGKPYQREFAREMAVLTPKVAGVRRTGSCAVDMAWVAAGRWDAYWERSLNAWDMAAGAILVREAGGAVTGVDGQTFDVHAGHICASNGAIHETLIDALERAREGTQ